MFAPGGSGGIPLVGAAPMGVLDHWPDVCQAWVMGGGWWLGSIALFIKTWGWGALRLWGLMLGGGYGDQQAVAINFNC